MKFEESVETERERELAVKLEQIDAEAGTLRSLIESATVLATTESRSRNLSDEQNAALDGAARFLSAWFERKMPGLEMPKL